MSDDFARRLQAALTANPTKETNVTLIFEAPEPDDPSVPDDPDPESEEE